MKNFDFKNKNNLLMLALFSVLGLNATWNMTSSNKTDFASKNFTVEVDKKEIKGTPDKNIIIEGEIIEADKNTGKVTVNLKGKYKGASSTTEATVLEFCKECNDLNRSFNLKDKKDVTNIETIKRLSAIFVKDGGMYDSKSVEITEDSVAESKLIKIKNDEEDEDTKKDPIISKCKTQFKKDKDLASVVNNSFLSCAVTQLGLLSKNDEKKSSVKYDIYKLYSDYIQPRLLLGMKDKEDSAERESAELLANEILKEVNGKQTKVRNDVNKLITAKWKIERELEIKEFKEAKKDESEARRTGNTEAINDALQRKNELLLDYANNFQDHYDSYSDAVNSRVGIDTGFTNTMAKNFIRDGMGKPFNYDPRYSDAERYGVQGMVAGWAASQLNGSGSYNDNYLGNSGYNERTVRNGLQGSSDRIFSAGQGFSRGLGANGGGQLQLNGSPNFSYSGNGGTTLYTPQSLGFNNNNGNYNNNGNNFNNNGNFNNGGGFNSGMSGGFNGGRFNNGGNYNNNFNSGFNQSYPYSSGSMINSGYNNGPQPRFGNSQFSNNMNFQSTQQFNGGYQNFNQNNGGPFINNFGSSPGINAGTRGGVSFQPY